MGMTDDDMGRQGPAGVLRVGDWDTTERRGVGGYVRGVRTGVVGTSLWGVGGLYGPFGTCRSTTRSLERRFDEYVPPPSAGPSDTSTRRLFVHFSLGGGRNKQRGRGR